MEEPSKRGKIPRQQNKEESDVITAARISAQGSFRGTVIAGALVLLGFKLLSSSISGLMGRNASGENATVKDVVAAAAADVKQGAQGAGKTAGEMVAGSINELECATG